jgi:hypothetical protein
MVPWGGFWFRSVAACALKNLSYPTVGDTRWRSWLSHYATSRKVAVSIPDEVIGFFNWPNHSSRIMALGSTQPLTEMSTRNLPGGKGRSAREADKVTTSSESIV